MTTSTASTPPALATRFLGSLPVSALGFGCMGLAGSYGAADEGDSLRTLRAALDAGVTLLDTADFYGGGSNEELVGRAVAGRRDGVVVATKTGVRRGPDGLVVDATPAS